MTKKAKIIIGTIIALCMLLITYKVVEASVLRLSYDDVKDVDSSSETAEKHEVTPTHMPTNSPMPEPTETPTPEPTATPYDGPEPYVATEKNISYTRESHHYSVSESFGSSFSYDNTYYVKVDLNAQIVFVYKRDSNGNPAGDPVKTFICSTGLKSNKSMATPVAKFVILDNNVKDVSKYRWCDVSTAYVQYATRLYYITNLKESGFDGYFTGFMFHSELYSTTNTNTLNATEWNTLGYPRSHGCIRMQVADAKWIYDNCHSGTIVECIDGKSNSELWKALKPAMIPNNQTYDPTEQ